MKDLERYLIESISARKAGKYLDVASKNYTEMIETLVELGFDKLDYGKFTYNLSTNGNLQNHGSKCFTVTDMPKFSSLYENGGPRYQICAYDGDDSFGWLRYAKNGKLLEVQSRYFEDPYGTGLRRSGVDILGDEALEKIEYMIASATSNNR